MVRREEQAWDPSASIILDSRVGAHAGRGMHNSLEWAISAAASIGIHFLDDGFSIEIYEADGPLHISGSMGQHSSASAELVISRLTDLGPAPTTLAALRRRVGRRSTGPASWWSRSWAG